jgi:hypothetical protein
MAVYNCLPVGYSDCFYSAQNAATNTTDLTYEAYRTAGRFVIGCFNYAQDNKIYVLAQINHNRRVGSKIRDVHVHVIPMVAPAANRTVYWRINYQWGSIGTEFLAPTSWGTNQTTQTILTTDGFKHLYHELVLNLAVPTIDEVSSYLMCEVIREGATEAGDDFHDAKIVGSGNCNLALLGVDMHYETDRLGSVLPTSL